MMDAQQVRLALQMLAATVTVLLGAVTIYRNRRKIRRIFRDIKRIFQPNNVDFQSTLERVKTTRILRVGSIIATPWFVRADDGTLTGIYRTIIDDIASRNSLQVIYTPIRNDVIFDKLSTGEVDLVAQLLQTAERASKATFAAYIHNVSMVAVIRKDQKKIQTVADLKKNDVRCAVVKGEIGSHIAPELFDMTEENNRLITLSTLDVPSVFHLVAGSGHVDVAIATLARWLELKMRDPEVANLLKPVSAEPLIKLPAGCLIKKNENDFKLWLERETQLTRGKMEIYQKEMDYIKPFSEAIDIL